MPDGSLNPIDAACARMHDRLVCCGRLEWRGGSGPREEWDSDSTREYFAYGPKDYDDARQLAGKVRQLPKPQQWLTLQEFYRDDDLATGWHAYTWFRKTDVILPGLARSINKRLRNEVNARLPEWERWREVDPEEIDGIRIRAIHMLCNRERLVEDAVEKLKQATYR